MTEWFRHWFGEEYLRLYAHRDAEDAARAAAFIDRIAPLDGRRVLDLACGPGRHLAPLAAYGARVVGCDLSRPLLRHARAAEDEVRLVRADMRALPFGARSFDVIVNLFTSFGYFADDAEHEIVVGAVARLLAEGGCFVLDYLNPPQVRATLVPEEQAELGGEPVTIRRALSADGRHVEKTVTCADQRHWVERVRLFTRDDLAVLATQAGLRVRAVFGDYDAGAWHPDAPRTVLVAEQS